jgi:hypothetical protein
MTNEMNGKNPFEGWTTIEDAARITGRNRVTIQNWARRGLIACYPVGPKIEVVNIEEVIACVKAHPPLKKSDRQKTEHGELLND